MLAQPFPIDLSQPAAQVLVIVFFLIPGLNATWALERLAGRTTLPPAERLFRAMAWSVLIYVAASPWLLRVGHRIAARRTLSPWEPIVGMALLVFVAPVALALSILALRRSKHVKDLLGRLTRIRPAPTPWDFAFDRGHPYFARVELRDGKMLGGLFGKDSFAAAYPGRQDLFLERAWRLDEEGSFVAEVHDTAGVWLRAEDIRLVEFLEPERERVHGHD
jgi:hypothetical protein